MRREPDERVEVRCGVGLLRLGLGLGLGLGGAGLRVFRVTGSK